jgi:hypothetical protein
MAAVQTLKGSFPLAFHRRLAPYVVKHRLRHSDYTIRECAVIVIYVPEIKDCEGDEQGYDKSHLVSFSSSRSTARRRGPIYIEQSECLIESEEI